MPYITLCGGLSLQSESLDVVSMFGDDGTLEILFPAPVWECFWSEWCKPEHTDNIRDFKLRESTVGVAAIQTCCKHSMFVIFRRELRCAFWTVHTVGG